MNLRPSTHVSFNLLKETKRFKTVLKAGNYFFSKRTNLYEAMPAAWKHMIEKQRRKFALLVDYFYAESRANPSISTWSLNNIKKIMFPGCVKLDDTPKLRCLYLAARHDDSVFVDSSEEDEDGEEEKDSETGDLTPKEVQVVGMGCELLDTYDGFALKPKKSILEYQENLGDMDVQMNLLQHMTNFTA